MSKLNVWSVLLNAGVIIRKPMSQLHPMRLVPFAAVAALMAWSGSSQAFAQLPGGNYTLTWPSGRTYSGGLVGSNPWSASYVPVSAVLIPLIFVFQADNGTLTKFDPTEPDSCDGGKSAEYRFRNSPLVLESSEITINGVKITGPVQYIDAFMRAQFWNYPAPGRGSNYHSPISWTFATAVADPLPVNIDPSQGVLSGTGCATQGIVSKTWLNNYLRDLIIPGLQSNGVIQPDKLALFMTRNVVASDNLPNPGTRGAHNWVSTTVYTYPQTYAWAAYDTTDLVKRVHDIKTLSHEIAEWMNDPYLTNDTPDWGGEGEVPSGSCRSTLEVGDPLTGHDVPVFKMDGYDYHLQELAFFQWFFENTTFPFGAGGVFSSHGTFTGPHAACPPGGSLKK